MKILVLTNTYPPYITGGYEIACYDNVERLRKKGHDVYILTSNYRKRENHPDDNDPKVFRRLWLERDFYQYKARLLADHQILRRQTIRLINKHHFKTLVNKINPDIIFCWNMGAVSSALITLSENCKPTVYYISDMWLAYPAPEIQIPGREPYFDKNQIHFLKRFYMKYMMAKDCIPEIKNLIFCSESLRQEYNKLGFNTKNSEIIYHGIDPKIFYPNSQPEINNSFCRLLFVGRILQIKGIETVIDVVNNLVHHKSTAKIRLTILGEGFPDYIAQLKKKIRENCLEDYIQWHTPVPRESLREIYWNHDILIFPSIWQEPFSLTVLEAMASGISIVSTLTGGSREILNEDINSLTFEAGNVEDLSSQLMRLINDPSLRFRLCQSALETIKIYSLDRMADQIDGYLMKILDQKKKV